MPGDGMDTKLPSESTINPSVLVDNMRGQSALILDCRPQAEYSKSHVCGAISVFLPSLMLRRLKAGKLNISCIIQNNEAKEKFTRLWKKVPVVLYDDTKQEQAASPSSVTSLLFKKFRQEGSRPIFLLGGFHAFEEQFPEYCEGETNGNNQNCEILGLCNLKISEDSAYGTCDSESGEIDSPTSHFPVEVIPHLYLGNAKNSADLKMLKECGISYILNVTPNVPNKFEEDTTFKYMKIPISDHLSQNLSRFFPDAISFIDEGRDNNQGVLVHCLAGISRSVTVTVAYLMQKQHLTLNEAYDYVKTAKPNISPNFNFMGQLLDFQKSLGRERRCACKGQCTCTEASQVLLEGCGNSGKPKPT